jgi:predicted MFS family arabinose efflux permease
LKSWSYDYTILLLCWLGWVSIYLSRSVLPPLLPILVEEMGITHTQAGLFGTVFLLGYIIIKVPAGLMARRFGIKKVLIAGMVGYGLATLLNFAAGCFSHLLILRFLLGLFQGIHLPLANTLLSRRFGRMQGKVIGFHESGPNLGHTLALPLTVAIAATLSWRWAFLFLSLPAFALALASTRVLREEDKPLAGGEISGSLQQLRGFLRLLVSMALAHSVYNLCLGTLFNFAPIYLVEFRGLSLKTAGLISMILPSAGFLSKVSSGYIAKKLGRRDAICLAAAISGLLILSLAHLKGPYRLSLIFLLIGLTLYSFSPTIYACVTSGLPLKLRALGLGVVTMVGNLTGALSTFVVGLLIDLEGYDTALTAVALTTLLAASSIYLMMRRRLERDG